MQVDLLLLWVQQRGSPIPWLSTTLQHYSPEALDISMATSAQRAASDVSLGWWVCRWGWWGVDEGLGARGLPKTLQKLLPCGSFVMVLPNGPMSQETINMDNTTCLVFDFEAWERIQVCSDGEVMYFLFLLLALATSFPPLQERAVWSPSYLFLPLVQMHQGWGKLWDRNVSTGTSGNGARFPLFHSFSTTSTAGYLIFFGPSEQTALPFQDGDYQAAIAKLSEAQQPPSFHTASLSRPRTVQEKGSPCHSPGKHLGMGGSSFLCAWKQTGNLRRLWNNRDREWTWQRERKRGLRSSKMPWEQGKPGDTTAEGGWVSK